MITQVAGITCTVDAGSQGQIRNLVRTTAFSGTTCTLDFTFSGFGLLFPVSPLPASDVSHGVVAGMQF